MKRNKITFTESPALRRGFTLIELLVVISIITLLVSIILPSLGKARIYTKRVVCMTRLKGISTAWAMYLDRNEDKPPMAVSLPTKKAETPPVDEVSIMDALSSEIDTPEAWHCPADDQNYFDDYGVSYEYFLGLFVPMLKSLETNPEAYAQLQAMQDEWIAEYGDKMTVLFDAAEFHPSSDNSLGRMCMYYDGHVDIYVEVEEFQEGE